MVGVPTSFALTAFKNFCNSNKQEIKKHSFDAYLLLLFPSVISFGMEFEMPIMTSVTHSNKNRKKELWNER